MAHSHLTQAKFVEETLKGLLGKPVAVKTLLKGDPARPVANSVFIIDSGAPWIVMGCDLPFICYAGALMLLTPVGIANEAIKAGVPSADLFDCYREVLNVASRMFELPGEPHLKLGPVFNFRQPLPEDVAAKFAKPAARIEFECTFPGYGVGHMSCTALAY